MDTITHTLFGLTLYGAVNKEGMSKQTKRALLVTAVGGSLIPDIDVISSLWDAQGRYQMWHRGLTHSLFLVPIWAVLFSFISRYVWKIRGLKLFGLGALAVTIHDVSDMLNAWGTGIFEPFSQKRVTLGTISIVDFAFWGIMLAGWVISRKGWWKPHRIYKIVWLALFIYAGVQSAQGYKVYEKYSDQYEQFALSASFVPGVFQFVGKQGENVDIMKTTAWSSGAVQVIRLESREGADLDTLFQQNPKARTLYEWSPLVVIVNDEERIGLYDPRFYRNGQSFLFEYIEKGTLGRPFDADTNTDSNAVQ